MKLRREDCRHDSPLPEKRWKCSMATAQAIARLHGKLVDQVASVFGCSLHEAASIIAYPFLHRDKFK